MSAIEQAKRAREQFALTRSIVLEDVADGKREALDAIGTLERQFTAASIRFYRQRPHGQKAWIEHGPQEELLEVRRAYVSPTSWSALLDRVRRAREERIRVRT